MIYQCYFKRAQESRLFLNLPYQPFGLAPEVNPHITRNCPELDRPEHRLQLCEFVAMLHLWRNPPDDGDDWIGFTSYRQLDKVPTIFMPGEIEAALQRGDAVTWARMQFNVSMATQCDWSHPGLMPFMIQMFRATGLKIPQTYFTSCEGIFNSYWAVRKTDFQQHMEWFYPAIDYCLKNLATDLYLRSSPRAASYALERLFMAWCWLNGKRVINYYTVKAEVDRDGNVLGVSSYFPRRHAYEAEAMLQAELAEWPDFVTAWLELAEVYLARGRWDQLEQTVQRLEKEFRRVVDAMAFRRVGIWPVKNFRQRSSSCKRPFDSLPGRCLCACNSATCCSWKAGIRPRPNSPCETCCNSIRAMSRPGNAWRGSFKRKRAGDRLLRGCRR